MPSFVWRRPSPGTGAAVWRFRRVAAVATTEEFLEADLRYWRKKLAGPLPVLSGRMSSASTGPEFPRSHGNRLLPSNSSGPCRDWPVRSLPVFFMALTAGFVALLQRYTGSGGLSARNAGGKPGARTEPLFGYFINMLPLRFDVSGDPTFRELLGRVCTSGRRSAMAHRRVLFLRILREVNAPRDPRRNPLFQLMITLEPLPHSVDPGWN